MVPSEEAEAQWCEGVQPCSWPTSLTVVPIVWYACHLARGLSHMAHGSADQPARSKSLYCSADKQMRESRALWHLPIWVGGKKQAAFPGQLCKFEANGSLLFNVTHAPLY